MHKSTLRSIARTRVIPVLLAAALVVGGLSGVAAAAARWAGNGRLVAPTTGQRVALTQPAALAPASLEPVELVLSLEGYGAEGALVDEDLTVADMLMYAIQDEYLAHGEYAAIVADYGNVRPYSNIIRSEETHIASLSRIYAAYGIEVPTDDSANHLVVPSSLLEAAEIGVQAEIDNIAMYNAFLAEDLPIEVSNVFEALRDASENHLRAFERQVDRLNR